MNPERLSKLQQQVRLGGRGTARRKKKIVKKVTTADDKKIQSSLKKLGVNSISGIEEVNMIKEDGKVLNFNNPTVQASLAANTFAISGNGEEKHFTDLLPNILNHLGSDCFNQLKKHASSMAAQGFGAPDAGDEDIPDLVGDFEAASKADAPAKKVEKGEEADDEDDDDEEAPALEKTKTKKASKKAAKKSASVDSDDDRVD